MENFLIDHLKKNEYEVFILTDFRKAKSVLTQNKDSMLFVNIDAEMPYSNWYNFMKSFANVSELQSIYLGVISEHAGWEEKDKFLMNIRLPGGFNIIDKKTEDKLTEFTKILDLNGAKGCRKYIRLDTRNEDDVSGYIATEDKLFTLNINDISSAGFAITYKQFITNLFQKNTLIRNLCLTAGRKSMVCSCIVFNTQLNSDGTATSVLMLTNENTESTRTYIRNYIFEKNSERLKIQLYTAESDSASYTDAEEYKSLKAVSNRNYDDLSPDEKASLEPVDGAATEEGAAQTDQTDAAASDDAAAAPESSESPTPADTPEASDTPAESDTQATS